MNHYSQNFYEARHDQTVYSANAILSRIISILPAVQSVVDVGCGVGTWLSISKALGAKEILGIDGPWVNKELLVIPKESFLVADLSSEITLKRRFDLAISLEVAEHLPSKSAHGFVRSLVHMSDFILFSAAIPLQGGKHHLNEQWPEYWAKLFAEFGYTALDWIRKEIWNDQEIPVWYRQNSLMFVRYESLKELKNSSQLARGGLPSLSVVHPDLFLAQNKSIRTVKHAGKLLLEAVKTWPQRKMSAEH